MASNPRKIEIPYIDRHINSLLLSAPDRKADSTAHFNQNEEFFLELPSEFSVPHLPIHHDVQVPRPEPFYLEGFRNVLVQLVPMIPGVLKDLIYYFEPEEILKPRFFRHYSLLDKHFLYILTIDLIYRTQEHTMIERGTNDITPSYRTNRLFLEGLFIPLDDALWDEDKGGSFTIRQTISDTWIGETGRGYFAKGIWMDDDLTKFFTKLFVPEGTRVYPYYPFVCRYKTVCHTLSALSAETRSAAFPRLQRALEFLVPHMERIEEELRGNSFSESLSIFRDLKEKVPAEWNDAFRDIRVDVYLNRNDMREFRID